MLCAYSWNLDCLQTLWEVALKLGIAVHCVILELGRLQQEEQELKAF